MRRQRGTFPHMKEITHGRHTYSIVYEMALIQVNTAENWNTIHQHMVTSEEECPLSLSVLEFN